MKQDDTVKAIVESNADKKTPLPLRPAPMPPGFYSNQAITRRNGGVVHQFIDDIGGCSANYR